MGIVHVSSRITQQRPIMAHELLDIVGWVEGQRQARKGIEVDLMTEVFVDGTRVWRASRPAFHGGEGAWKEICFFSSSRTHHGPVGRLGDAQ